MPWPKALTLLVLCSLCILATADEKPCTVHDGDKFYDLNPLKSRKDYEFKSLGGHEFVINICRGLSHDTWGLNGKVPNPGDVAGYIRQDHGDFSVGTINTTLTIRGDRPLLTYTNGSPCRAETGGTQMTASTAIEFICDTSVFAVGKPDLIIQLPPGDDEAACAFLIEWRTHFACPTGERGGPWGVFAVLAVTILVVLMLYIVLGTLYNRYVLHLTGFDQIPQFSLESMKYHGGEAVEWFRDAMSRFYEGGQRMGTNPVSHQTQAGVGDPNAGVFVRAPRRGNASGARRVETNPVSHQNQAQGQAAGMDGFGRPRPASRVPEAPKPRARRFDVESGSGVATREEGEFMLGDDEDEEGEEMEPMKTPARDPADASAGANAGGGAGMDAGVAVVRGPGGVVRL